MDNLKILKAIDIIRNRDNKTNENYEDLLIRIAVLFPSCVIQAENHSSFEYEIKQIWENKGKIYAIKEYRSKCNCDLKEAKYKTEEICKDIKAKQLSWT